LVAVDDGDPIGKPCNDLGKGFGDGSVLPISLGAIARGELRGKSNHTF
jgi:hypothetical protein